MISKLFFVAFLNIHFSSAIDYGYGDNSNYNYDNRSPVKYPICVVGAGLSGLTVATLLQRKGYEVVVFEKDERVGGKVYTFRKGDEVQVEMCPFFHDAWSHTFLSYVNQFHLTSIPFNDTDRVIYSYGNPLFSPPPAPPTGLEKQMLADALKRYGEYRSLHKKDIEFGYLYTSPELFYPINIWLRLNKMEALTPILTFVVTKFGYGSLDETPALYLLKYVDTESMYSLASSRSGTFRTVKEGLDIFVDKLAAPLNVALKTGVAHVIRYGQDKQELVLQNGVVVTCGKVILAFPPLFDKINQMVVDLTEQEKDVFQQIRIQKFTSAANHIPNLESQVYVIDNATGDGEVVGFLRQSPKKLKDVYSSYSWIRGSFTSTPTYDELLLIDRKLETLIKRMSKDAKILDRKTSEYFPHVETQSLANGFYREFNSIQGRQGLYFLTTALSFEIMDTAMAAAHDFVNKYFYEAPSHRRIPYGQFPNTKNY